VGELPLEVEDQIKAWGKYWGKIGLRGLVLLEVKDDATLQELRSDPELAQALMPYRPRGAVAVVPREAVERLKARLEERGIAWEE
jgi:hypothetical protein